MKVSFAFFCELTLLSVDVFDRTTRAMTIAAGALADVHGNPNLAFAGSYTLDIGTVPFPTPLAPACTPEAQAGMQHPLANRAHEGVRELLLQRPRAV